MQAEHDKRETEQKPELAFFAIQRLDDESGAAIGRVGPPKVFGGPTRQGDPPEPSIGRFESPPYVVARVTM